MLLCQANYCSLFLGQTPICQSNTHLGQKCIITDSSPTHTSFKQTVSLKPKCEVMWAGVQQSSLLKKMTSAKSTWSHICVYISVPLKICWLGIWEVTVILPSRMCSWINIPVKKVLPVLDIIGWFESCWSPNPIAFNSNLNPKLWLDDGNVVPGPVRMLINPCFIHCFFCINSV